MNKAKLLKDHLFSREDLLLFDTNIWIFIDGPIMSKKYDYQIEVYSRMLRDIKRSQAKVFINETIASEFVNAFIRIDMGNQNIEMPSNDKSYRDRQEYRDVVKVATTRLVELVNRATGLDLNFRELDIDSISSWMTGRKCDYNDAVIAKFCLDNDLSLVTDDADFSAFSEIPILTANSQLLR